MTGRLVDPSIAEGGEAALRPARLSDFVGQRTACDNLAVFVEAARARGEALDHVLLFGPPGLGKTDVYTRQDHEMASFTEALGRAPARIPGIDDDLEATLALMVLLDELVGVSSTNIHLRALTGKPARVLVPYPPDFRWMSRQGKSPWFPEMETYRQKIGSSWDDVFDRLRGDLERLYPA